MAALVQAAELTDGKIDELEVLTLLTKLAGEVASLKDELAKVMK